MPGLCGRTTKTTPRQYLGCSTESFPRYAESSNRSLNDDRVAWNEIEDLRRTATINSDTQSMGFVEMPGLYLGFGEQGLAQNYRRRTVGNPAAISDRGDYTAGCIPLANIIDYLLLVSPRLSTLSGSSSGRGS